MDLSITMVNNEYSYINDSILERIDENNNSNVVKYKFDFTQITNCETDGYSQLECLYKVLIIQKNIRDFLKRKKQNKNFETFQKVI